MPSYLTRSVARKDAIENKSGPVSDTPLKTTVSVKEVEDKIFQNKITMYNAMLNCQLLSIAFIITFLVLLASK